MKKTLILLGMAAALLVSCKDKNNDDNGAKAREQARLDSLNANKKVDNFLYDIMSDYYLWNSNMPRMQKDESRFPGDFFESLLYRAKDRWSFCVEDGESYMSESEGTPYSMGYSPQFWPYNNYENVLIVVEFVFPGSPADRAGLKRGDIIIEIDGEPMTVDNYYDFYSKEHATYTLAGYDPVKNQLYLTGRKMSMQAEIIEADPSIYDTIFNVGGKPVGYFVYTSFTRNTDYFATIDAAFDRFKAAGVKDLILDLRYNGGGDIEAAGYLASAIAPASVPGKEVLIRYEYNNILTNYFKKNRPDELVVKFPKNDHNADMQNLYVIGTRGTASASELVTTGLMPYMNVTLVGDTTYGKCTGMFVFYGGDEGLEDLGKWVFMPVTMKYANANGFTDFVDGLIPDYRVDDDLLAGHQLGDANEPMLATALDVIAGLPLTAKAAQVMPFKVLDRNHSVFRNNLIAKPKLIDFGKK
ncbi:MAG: PDZ domain-containing protein [Salinivirgaceae bacterium]|nr:PDZ domain-containing protein [Salinivirgaceae bacterium]